MGNIPDPLAGGLAPVAERLARGEVTSVALVRACLDRIAALDGALRSFVTLDVDQALAAAHHADRRRAAGDAGPLLGVPVTVKDMFDIRGLPNTAGMPLRAGAIATGDAALIARLKGAGSVILGTVKLAEGVFGEYRPEGSAPINPRGADLWPGASSGGSAVAVAARFCAASLASDTGGSARMPAAVTGTTGFKPGYGQLSLDGAFPLAPSFDHAGVIAATARDAGLVWSALSDASPSGPGPSRPVIGLDPDWLTGCDPEVLGALEAAIGVLQGQGAQVVKVRLPSTHMVAADWYTVASTEIAGVHAAMFRSAADGYGPALAGAIRAGQATGPATLAAAQARLADFVQALQRAMQGVDALALPVFPFLPPRLEAMATMDEPTILALHRYTCPFSVSGLPALVLPAGVSAAGLPLAIQLAGPAGAENTLITLGTAFQQVTNWHRPVTSD